MSVNLEESYYELDNFEHVEDCDHGKGWRYSFKDNGRVLAFTFYPNSSRISFLDITEDRKNEPYENGIEFGIRPAGTRRSTSGAK